jgi:small-conductance mechanosensitive channel
MEVKPIFEALSAEVIVYYDALIGLIPRLLLVLLVFSITWLLARQVRRISGAALKRNMEDPLLAIFLSRLVKAFIYIIGISVMFKILGLGGITASILAGAGITAFIIGFALKDIGENFLAGILLAFKRPFRVGDYIETHNVRGRVLALNIRDTQIKTDDGKDVYLPNANIIKTPLINYTIDGFLRYDFTVALGDGADFEKAMMLIEHTLIGIDGVLGNQYSPKVQANIAGGLRIELFVAYWIDTFKSKHLESNIRTKAVLAVRDALKKAGY